MTIDDVNVSLTGKSVKTKDNKFRTVIVGYEESADRSSITVYLKNAYNGKSSFTAEELIEEFEVIE